MHRLLRSAGFSAASLALAMPFVIAAVGFVCAAIYLALVPILAPPVAALATAGAALLIAGLIMLTGRLLARRPAAVAGAADANRLAAEIGTALGGEAASLASTHPRGTLVGSLLLGFAVGASPKLRSTLRDLLKTRSD